MKRPFLRRNNCTTPMKKLNTCLRLNEYIATYYYKKFSKSGVGFLISFFILNRKFKWSKERLKNEIKINETVNQHKETGSTNK